MIATSRSDIDITQDLGGAVAIPMGPMDASKTEEPLSPTQTQATTLPANGNGNGNKSSSANPPDASQATMIPVMAFKTPKNTLLTVIKAGMAKGKMTAWKILIMGFMAGMYIGVAGLLSFFIVGGSPGLRSSNIGLAKFLGAALFPVGLFLVVVSGAELFTGNVMYVGVSVLARKSTWKDLAKSWAFSYIGNLAGSLFAAFFLAYLPEIVHFDPFVSYVRSATYSKIYNGWGSNFLRGIGCNWLVDAALFFAIASDDMAGKIMAMWFPIMGFILLGYEHCVANMFLIPLGLMEGANSTVGDFIAFNLIPVTLGNIVGGFVFVGLVEWMVYSDYFGEMLHHLKLTHGHKPHKKQLAVAVSHPHIGPAKPTDPVHPSKPAA